MVFHGLGDGAIFMGIGSENSKYQNRTSRIDDCGKSTGSHFAGKLRRTETIQLQEKPRPRGANKLSPALQRWENCRRIQVPEGRPNSQAHSLGPWCLNQDVDDRPTRSAPRLSRADREEPPPGKVRGEPPRLRLRIRPAGRP